MVHFGSSGVPEPVVTWVAHFGSSGVAEPVVTSVVHFGAIRAYRFTVRRFAPSVLAMRRIDQPLAIRAWMACCWGTSRMLDMPPDPSTLPVPCGKRFHIRKWCTLKPNK